MRYGVYIRIVCASLVGHSVCSLDVGIRLGIAHQLCVTYWVAVSRECCQCPVLAKHLSRR